MFLVTGATGQLGYDVMAELHRRKLPCIGVGSGDFDLTEESQVRNFLLEGRFSAVIHCAAYTAVDKAEDETEMCHKVNVLGTTYLAKVCHEIGAKLLYISTDYVFSGEGDKPFDVDSPLAPLNVYGKSKALGEKAVKEYMKEHFILRISWVYGQNGNNFVKTMLRLGKEKESLSVVADQIGSPSYTVDLARLICDMIVTEKYGVYHGTNEGFCSWAEFAREIMKQAGLSCEIKGITTEEYPTKAKRPQNSRLSKASLKEAGFEALPRWGDGLIQFFKDKETHNDTNHE